MNQDMPMMTEARASAGMFTPIKFALLIGLATLTADQVMSIADLRRTSAQLTTAIEAQAQPLLQARRIEAQLDALASGSARLAEDGNANARAIVARLKASGVSIDPGGRKQTE